MRVKTIGAGPHPDISKSGAYIEIGGVAIDCDERQGDSAQLIDLRARDGVIAEGGEGRQVATIHIPPRQYIEVDSDEPEESGESGTVRQAVELDPNTVTVTLWTYNQ